MKKSQEIDEKIQDLTQLKNKYLPSENNSKIRYYSPIPNRVIFPIEKPLFILYFRAITIILTVIIKSRIIFKV